MSQLLDRVRAAAAGYAPGQGRPLRGYLLTMAAYAGLTGTLAGLARLTGRTAPERISGLDVMLISCATHKVSRLLAKDSVTSPLRAPFTRYEGTTGDAELGEQVRGTGVGHSVGELVSCPFCLGGWVATGVGAGLVLAARVTPPAPATLPAVDDSGVRRLVAAAIHRLALPAALAGQGLRSVG